MDSTLGSPDWHALKPHPAAPCPDIQLLRASAVLHPQNRLHVAFELGGNMPSLHWPHLRPQAFVDGLWQTTCFELFIGSDNSPAYLEFNFSPSQEWCAYRFEDYRSGRTEIRDIDVSRCELRRQSDAAFLTVAFTLPASMSLDPEHARLGLTAVIESRSGQISYWALAHPSERPDFHHKDGFQQRLRRGEDI
ncbi:DOMON-like domain-containing protein [Henriciella sp. AS95]|uniref:DOMON-like domain-containing protein n=1 Tax=Henriciella sp. AS95 TaxID=3135782 RepID=UPI00316F33BC